MHVCAYWDCKSIITDSVFLCISHYWSFKDGFINQCPKCGRFKGIGYNLCGDCYHERRVKQWKLKPIFMSEIKQYELEHSDKWKNYNKGEGPFFAYILQLDDGTFYAGHTDDLRSRRWEHKDGTTRSTAGRNPKLKYFEKFPTRDEARSREAELKPICKSNPREIRRMIIEFGDNIGALEIG